MFNQDVVKPVPLDSSENMISVFVVLVPYIFIFSINWIKLIRQAFFVKKHNLLYLQLGLGA